MNSRANLMIFVLAVASGASWAQQLPAPSRTIFRCEVNGKVSYSDEPCPAAKRIDVEPTRGLTSTGNERAGADVSRERHREQMAEALRPVTGMDPQQFEVARKRIYLRAEDQRECRALDASIQRTETQERELKGSQLAAVQAELLRQRKRFRELKC